MALATLEDFELRHGPVLDAEESQVSALLDDASSLIESSLGELPESWTGESASVPAIAVAVCIQVAYRAWSNPDGIAREELGEASRTYRGSNQADVLWLTENEAKLIRRAAGKSRITSIPVETSFSADPGTGVSPMDFWPIEEEGS